MDKKIEEEKLFFSNHLPSDSSMLLFPPHQSSRCPSAIIKTLPLQPLGKAHRYVLLCSRAWRGKENNVSVPKEPLV